MASCHPDANTAQRVFRLTSLRVLAVCLTCSRPSHCQAHCSTHCWRIVRSSIENLQLPAPSPCSTNTTQLPMLRAACPCIIHPYQWHPYPYCLLSTACICGYVSRLHRSRHQTFRRWNSRHQAAALQAVPCRYRHTRQLSHRQCQRRSGCPRHTPGAPCSQR